MFNLSTQNETEIKVIIPNLTLTANSNIINTSLEVVLQ